MHEVGEIVSAAAHRQSRGERTDPSGTTYFTKDRINLDDNKWTAQCITAVHTLL